MQLVANRSRISIDPLPHPRSEGDEAEGQNASTVRLESGKKLSHGASACLPNADSSLSGVAPLGLVKGAPLFRPRTGAAAPRRVRVAPRRTQSKLDCVSGISCKRKANSALRQRWDTDFESFPMCAQARIGGWRKYFCSHARTIPSSARRRCRRQDGGKGGIHAVMTAIIIVITPRTCVHAMHHGIFAWDSALLLGVTCVPR